jgi:hypothetical protein
VVSRRATGCSSRWFWCWRHRLIRGYAGTFAELPPQLHAYCDERVPLQEEVGTYEAQFSAHSTPHAFTTDRLLRHGRKGRPCSSRYALMPGYYFPRDHFDFTQHITW